MAINITEYDQFIGDLTQWSTWDRRGPCQGIWVHCGARYLDNSEKIVRDRYSHIEAGELGDIATEASTR
jgi:hypothetical protein